MLPSHYYTDHSYPTAIQQVVLARTVLFCLQSALLQHVSKQPLSSKTKDVNTWLE